MRSFLSKLKESWGWVLLAVGSVLALFRLKDKYDSALSHEKNSKSLIKDASLSEKVESNKTKLKVIDSDKAKAISKAKEANVVDIEDYYNGKK